MATHIVDATWSVKRTVKRLIAQVGHTMFVPWIPPYWEDPRTSAATKVAQIAYVAQLQSAARSGQSLPRLQDCGFRVFSQFEEDGYLLYLASVLEITTKTFVDIGAADGVNSNCANLALNHGWHGLYVDCEADNIARGEAFYRAHRDSSFYAPVFRKAFVTRENINEVIGEAGFRGPVGVVSVDIDGNDYWIWDALTVVEPMVVIIEAHVEYGMRDIVVPYDAGHVYPAEHPDYMGASPPAIVRLARRKGYRLVGANRFGFNLLFAKNGRFEDRVPEIALDVLLTHPRYSERRATFEAVRNCPFATADD